MCRVGVEAREVRLEKIGRLTVNTACFRLFRSVFYFISFHFLSFIYLFTLIYLFI